MAAAAALVLAFSLTHNPNRGRKEIPPVSLAHTELSVSHPTAVSGESKELEAFAHQALHSRSRALGIAGHPNFPALGDSGVEVLGPQGQEELLGEYMEGVPPPKAPAPLWPQPQHHA